VQTVLKQGRCYEGPINGRINETQGDLDRYISTTSKRGRSRPDRIELAKASATDFETWLRDADEVTGDVCVTKPTPPKQEAAKPPRHEVVKPQRQEAARQVRQQREEAPRARPERRAAEPRESSGGGGGKTCFGGGRNELVACR